MVPVVVDAAGERRDAKQDVAATPVCKDDAGPATKSKGDPCTCNGDCRTGQCADGVCCTSSCSETCKACNLPGALGECSLIPRGVPPASSGECPAEKQATCGRNGNCDGKGGCQRFVEQIVCDNGICDGDGLVGVKTCDGEGNCAGGTSKACAPFACNPDTDDCRDSCTTTAECVGGQECSSRSCGLKLNGTECGAAAECASGRCVDGYCCNAACTGACVSCALPGFLGRCQLLAAGQPSSKCPAEAQSTCGTTGYCDSAGACEKWPAEVTPCVSSTCSGATLLTATAVCDGKGACQTPQLIDCAPYRCANGACNSRCRSDADCEPDRACVFAPGSPTGTCGLKPPGQTCGEPSECLSGHCVDGVCCESACEGSCRSCALPGSPGQCTNLPTGARDPRKTCVDEGVASCGYNGLCDGSGACQIYPVGTKCGNASCTGIMSTTAPTCNQNRQCLSPAAITCSPYICNGSVCFGACSRDADCVPPNACVNGSCGKKPPGAECSAPSECLSGFCAQGVCCNFACSEACKSCNLATSRGECRAVPDGTLDPQELCKVTDKATCGTTGACRTGACAVVAAGTICKSAACAGTTTYIPPSACDGRGTCLTPANIACSPFICGANACLRACQADSDCQAPNTCVNNQCGLKVKGAPCTATSQCESGLTCTEGVCCDSACSDGTTGSLCVSCKVSGKVGTCTRVATGQPDPKQRCAASDPTKGNCSNNGTCNGAGACSAFSDTTPCDDASRCTTGDVCQSGTCKGTAVTCATDQCHEPGTCNPTTGLCTNPNKPDGTTCNDDSACTRTDTCQSGTCRGGNPIVCAASDQCHDVGTCNPGTGVCTNPNKPEGAICNDGDACTRTDTCAAGACRGANPVTCAASDQCHDVGTCSPSTGLCSNPNKLDGTTCNDANACTRTDTCVSGTCSGANPVVCSALDQCHETGTCAPSTGLCSNPNKTNGATCSDGNACTQADTCQDGTCSSGAAVTCPVADQCHAAASCNPTTGCVTGAARPDGTLCNDGTLCTTGETCQAGVCSGGTAVTCVSPTQCQLSAGASCNPGTGACSYPSKPDGDPCSDGNACTQPDSCGSGVCVAGAAVVCTSPSACQVAGTCDTTNGCPTLTDALDGTPCGTEGSTCQAGICVPPT